VVQATYWKHKYWGLTQGKETPLAGCRAMWTNKRSVGSLDSPLQKHVLWGLLPSHNEEDRLRPHLWMPVFPTTAPPLHTPCLLHVADLHWSRGCHNEAESWNVGKSGASGPGQHLGGRAGPMLMEGTYIASVSGEVLISDGGQTATADDPVCSQSP